MISVDGIYIVGASYQGRVAVDVLRSHHAWEILGFIDDDQCKHGKVLAGIGIAGGIEHLLERRTDRIAAFVAIGNNDARCRVARILREAGIPLVNAVHRSAVLMSGTTIGSNVFVCAGAVLVTGTTVADDCVINTASSIDHDSEVHRGAYVSPGVHTAGGVQIGERAFIGVGCALGPGVRIGTGSVVGAGSMVLSDVPDNVFAYGTPARVIRELSNPIDWSILLSGPRNRHKDIS